MSVICPVCKNSLSVKKETINGTDVLIFECYKHFINVVNDMSKIKSDIEKIINLLDHSDQ
jgi:hypothetical protein